MIHNNSGSRSRFFIEGLPNQINNMQKQQMITFNEFLSLPFSQALRQIKFDVEEQLKWGVKIDTCEHVTYKLQKGTNKRLKVKTATPAFCGLMAFGNDVHNDYGEGGDFYSIAKDMLKRETGERHPTLSRKIDAYQGTFYHIMDVNLRGAMMRWYGLYGWKNTRNNREKEIKQVAEIIEQLYIKQYGAPPAPFEDNTDETLVMNKKLTSKFLTFLERVAELAESEGY